MGMHIEQSLRGVSVSSIQATPTGFEYDRHFMLWDVNKSENLHIGLRPALCLFSTKLLPEGKPDTIEVDFSLDHVFDRPDKPISQATLAVPLFPKVEGLEERTVTMHLSPTPAYDMGEKYNSWFSDRLGYPVKLLYIGDYRRKVLGNMGDGVASSSVPMTNVVGMSIPITLAVALVTHKTFYHGAVQSAPLITSVALLLAGCVFLLQRLGLGLPGKSPMITFADLAAYLVISKTSYEDVNGRLPDDEEMDISKFRANIVVSGAEKPWEEDFWAEMVHGEDTLIKLTQNCARCASLNVDYATGKPGVSEAGKVLKKLSRDRRVDPGTKWSPIFGKYGFIMPRSGAADGVVMRVGDPVRVTKRNTARTVTDYPKS
ncbi:hypothetical protein F5X68DRAFT_195968 [Plectosphaerella plurivora]|uniref:MOSC domain-containing protein n=1 Tax=Plectosphaerella plurivora TaxID=936078 RepID=A0A9P8V0I4_9PEZI|nr:hypothetical protein F5X68DRAFT_195968 [Plectosphaerella plurivora]